MRQGKVLQITFCVVILFSCAFFTFLYWNDNKYKNDPNEGIRYLYDNWEFYYGVLLTPEDLKNGDTKGAYMEYVKIGEVNNYSNHNPYRAAHGCGTYVIHLKYTRLTVFTSMTNLSDNVGSPERMTKITRKGFRRKSIPLRQQASVHCFWRREMNPIITVE